MSRIDVYDSSLNLLSSRNANGSGHAAKVFLNGVGSGETYYIRVTGIGRAIGNYQLLVSQPDTGSAPPADPATNVASPDVFHDSAGQVFPDARQIAMQANKGDDVGRIEPADDTDFYVFEATETGRIDIDVNPDPSLTTLVTLYDDQQDANDDGLPDGVDTDASDSADGISHFEYDVVAGGTYYIAVESKDQNSTGRYEVHIKPFDPATAPGNSGTDWPPGPLPGWGGVNGVQIDLDSAGNGSSQGSIDDPREVDWYQINGTQSGNMQVTVAGVNDDLTEFVTAFRADGGGIDTDAGDVDGQASVAFTVEEDETIIVAVSSHNGRSTGAYTIDVSQPAELPDDDHPDLGQSPRNLSAEVTDEGNGYIRGRIEEPTDDDWFRIPVRGEGFLTIEVDQSGSSLTSFLELSRDGTTSGFFETDDGRDGRARVTFLPEAGMDYVWAKVSSVDGTQGQYTLNVWRTQNPDDDHPDRGGRGVRGQSLGNDGHLVITGSIDHPGDTDAFRALATRPGPVAIEVVSLTEGFTPLMGRSIHHDDPNLRSGTSGGGSGRGGTVFEILPEVSASPDNWINISVSAEAKNSTTPFGDYILHVWQPETADDLDPDTIGSEASPILVDGTGNGALPGEPNAGETTPAINHAGDKDVFQVRAASDRPITFAVDGSSVSGGTFLRVYDATGTPIATDRNSGPNGESQVTIEAFRGDLYYLEVTAFDETSTGSYTVQVTQPTDDHPDVAIFTSKESQTHDATAIALDADGFGEVVGEIGTNIVPPADGGEVEADLVGDRDVFQVTAPRRGLMTVNVATTDDLLDTFVRVYDSRGNLVAVDDDGGDGRNSSVTFNTCQYDTYIDEDSGYGDSSVGAYRVTVQHGDRPRQLFVGTYDGFGDSSLNDDNWRSETSGRATIEEASGRVLLQAEGQGANSANNTASLESRATVAGGVEFDFTPRLGTTDNSASIDITAGTDFIRLQMEPDGSGGIALTVENGGYTELENDGVQSLTAETAYHARIAETADGIEVLLDGTRVALFEGSLNPDSVLRGDVEAARLSLYDNFNDNSIDGNRWNTSGDVFENGERLHLWLYRNGGLRDSRATTQGKPGGTDIDGFKLNSDRTAGTVGPGQAEAWVGVTNGSDYVRIRWLSDVNQMIVQTGGAYGDRDTAARWDPDQPGPAETPDGPVEIRERNGNIEFLHNNKIRYTLSGQSIRPGSWFEAVAFGQNGEDGPLNRDYELTIDDLQLYTGESRLAELEFDNVKGTLHLPDDPMAASYDSFGDSSIDHDRWQIAGRVEEAGGRLRLPLFRNGEPVSGFVSSSGSSEGTNLRGFRLNSSRTTEPKTLSGWDTVARMSLTNGSDFIRIDHDLKHNTFEIQTGGSYGSHATEISVPDGQIPDGPLEVRERDGNIEVLHNNSVKLTLQGQTVRGGSYFTFETNGNPFGQETVDPPQDFDASIDKLVFYKDPEPTEIQVTPSLAQASDSGVSDTDHITNNLSLDFEWTAGPDGTRYQWRQGELQDNGSVAYDQWSDPLSGTTATVNLPHGSVHVLSVRAIDEEGIVGQPNARAVLVDTDAPAVDDLEVLPAANPELTVSFSEPVYGSEADITILDENGEVVTPVSIDGLGTSTLSIVLPELSGQETFTVTLDGVNSLTDIAGNRLDGDADGTAGGNYAATVTVVPPAPLEVTTISVNDGELQRSNLETLDIQFSEDTNLQDLIDSGAILDAVEIHGLTINPGEVALAAGAFRWNASTFTLTVDLTIDGFGGSDRTILGNDNYELRLKTAQIAAAEDIDKVMSDTDGLMDGLFRFDFHRLEGDFDGDKDVDIDDRDAWFDTSLVRFGASLGDSGYNSAFDFDGDGIISSRDYYYWLRRDVGTSLP